MEKVILSVDELNNLIRGAVDAAFIAHQKGDETILISREETAKRLGVDKSTLWRWNKNGYFKHSVRMGRAVFYTEKAIIAFQHGEREV